MAIKVRLYDLLEGGNRTEPAQRLVDYLLGLLIVSNVLAVALESVPRYEARHGEAFQLFEAFSLSVFTIEYLIRLWVCTEHPPLKRLPPWQARRRYAASPFMVIDLLAILPAMVVGLIGLDLRFLRIFRLLRLLKLARYSPTIITLGRVLYEERRALGAVLIIMFGLLMLSASIMTIVESEAQPDDFGSIPAAMWWALATLTTVGYGDVVPVTALGRIFGGFVTILGIGMYALPIAIIAAGFTNESRRRDFVITWGMVARVPLFAKLDPVSLAKVAGLLRSRSVPSGYEIAHRGQPADCMYFIVSGEVVVDIGDRRVTLEEGDFFGEIALLYDTQRRAHAFTLTECRLMLLMKTDFHGLMETEPQLREEVAAVARERLRDREWAEGDIAEEEILAAHPEEEED
ncbi:MAG: cyclic nucleotide-gated ion channel [Alphaproteobacteria bacterium]|jgi:voltage-gated potassium channel|nr:cyclic nucleotide-gated ion channel [Alphaproteobacteria bacterium]MDP6567193.1 cyclic nucleotide-gated ion channel [Alphaproteobacteria bacterium]